MNVFAPTGNGADQRCWTFHAPVPGVSGILRNVHFQSRSTHHVPWLIAATLLLSTPGLASAGAVRPSLQPLGVVGSVSQPVCDGPAAPLAASELASTTEQEWAYGGYFTGPTNALAELGGGLAEADLQAVATICSPTFQGLPAPITGTVATSPKRTRVGQGWRELGGALADPAQLLPGDALEIPQVDDAARLKLAVAPGIGQPTTVLELTDLAPGPSKVSIAQDARGLVATITRADGSTAETTGAPTKLPALQPTIGGTPSRWKITTTHLPNSAVVASREDREEAPSTAALATAGRITMVLRTKRRKRSRDRTADLTLVATNRAAQVIDVQNCNVGLTRRGTPKTIRCATYATSRIIRGYGDYYALSAALRAKAIETVVRRIARTPVTAPRRPAARRHAARPTSSVARRARATAPLTVRPTPRTPVMRELEPSGLKPLAADVNGDGGVDYWAERWDESRSAPLRGTAAGMVFVSGPGGLSPHRVDLPGSDYVDSDVSAIADVTGDGIGELVVDLEERHGIIPGSAAWTGTTYRLVPPDLTDLQPTDRVLRLSLSSPGSPFGSLNDVTGDGKAEIAAADDSGAWFSIPSQGLLQGYVTDLPSVARPAIAPAEVTALAKFDEGAPHVSPVTRIIGGQAIGLRWPTVATSKAPTGTVELAVRDALGRELRPTISVQTPGNALLLDYDQISGDALLLSIGTNCAVSPYVSSAEDCDYTLLRVGPDGKVQQRVTAQTAEDVSTSPLSSARFLPDGPDADARVDVALVIDPGSVALLTSTAAGEIAPDSLSIAELVKIPTRTWGETSIRLYPVVAPGGARKLVVPLPTITRDTYSRRNRAYYNVSPATSPAEVVWK